MAALYVTADALEDAADGDRFVSWLGLAAAGAALASLVQVLACPSPEPARGLARWFFHRCDRARAFFSIYMTLAGVLSIALLATAAAALPGGGLAPEVGSAWLITLAGLVATYTRGRGSASRRARSRSSPPSGAAVSSSWWGWCSCSGRRPSAPTSCGIAFATCSIRGVGHRGAALHVAERPRHVAGAAAPRLGPRRRQARVLTLRLAGGVQEAHGARAQHAAPDPGRARDSRPRRLARRSGSRSTGRPSPSSGGSIRAPRASGPSWSGASRR